MARRERIPPLADFRAARTFELPEGAPLDRMEAVLSFWGSCGFAMQTLAPGRFGGRRGSLFGNYTSFDVRRLQTELSVEATSARVAVEMRVKGTGQIVTEYNRAYLALELAEFESVMHGGGRLPEAWKSLLKAARKSFWAWSFSGGVKGATLADETEAALRAVGADLDEVGAA